MRIRQSLFSCTSGAVLFALLCGGPMLYADNPAYASSPSGTVPSFTGGCPVYSAEIPVDVTVIAGDVRVDNTRSVYDLKSEKIDGTVASRNRAEYQVSGLTKGTISVSREIAFKTYTRSDGGGCIHPESVKITVNLANTIYIANKYSPGTCEFRETYNHEIKHVNVDRTVLNRYVPYMKSQVSMVASMQGVKEFSNNVIMSNIKTQMNNTIRNTMDSVVEKMQQERAERQNGVDTVAEYARVSKACRNF